MGHIYTCRQQTHLHTIPTTDCGDANWDIASRIISVQHFERANNRRRCTTISAIKEHTAENQISARRVRVRSTAGSQSHQHGAYAIGSGTGAIVSYVQETTGNRYCWTSRVEYCAPISSGERGRETEESADFEMMSARRGAWHFASSFLPNRKTSYATKTYPSSTKQYWHDTINDPPIYTLRSHQSVSPKPKDLSRAVTLAMRSSASEPPAYIDLSR